MAVSSIAIVGCSLVLDAAGPYDSAGGDAGATFCASLRPAPQLCSDFDEGKMLDAGWSSVFETGEGTLALQSGVVFSPPDSLNATTPSFSTTEPAESYPRAGLTSGLSGNAGTVHLESRIRIDAIGAEQCFVALAITQQAPGGHYLQAELLLCSDHAFAQEQDNSCSCTKDMGLRGALSLGTWHWFVIEIAYGDGSTPSMTFWIDDPMTAALGPVDLTYGWQSSPYAVQTGIGYIGGGAGEEIQAYFDNVAAWVR
jgi:hypothetical protein